MTLKIKPVKVKQSDIMRAKGYLPAPEVARLIGRDVTTIYDLIERKELNGFQVGRSWYVEAKSVAVYLGPAASKLFGLVASAAK
jgi:hypothetical protein